MPQAMETVPSAAGECPACGGKNIVRINENSLNFKRASHRCESCGVQLSSQLPWSKAMFELGLGVSLAVVCFGIYKVSGELVVLSPQLRIVGFFALIGGTFGFTAQRIFRAIRFKPWLPS